MSHRRNLAIGIKGRHGSQLVSSARNLLSTSTNLYLFTLEITSVYENNTMEALYLSIGNE